MDQPTNAPLVVLLPAAPLQQRPRAARAEASGRSQFAVIASLSRCGAVQRAGACSEEAARKGREAGRGALRWGLELTRNWASTHGVGRQPAQTAAAAMQHSGAQAGHVEQYGDRQYAPQQASQYGGHGGASERGGREWTASGAAAEAAGRCIGCGSRFCARSLSLARSFVRTTGGGGRGGGGGPPGNPDDWVCEACQNVRERDSAGGNARRRGARR